MSDNTIAFPRTEGAESIDCQIRLIRTCLAQKDTARMVEAGIRMSELKSMLPHGQFIKTMTEKLEISRETSSRMMSAALKLERLGLPPLLMTWSRSKVVELLTLDDDCLAELMAGWEVEGYTLAALQGMSVRGVRAAVRAMRSAEAAELKGMVQQALDRAKRSTTLSLPLAQGHRVMHQETGHQGTVQTVYGDGSASVLWDGWQDNDAGISLGVPGALLRPLDADAPRTAAPATEARTEATPAPLMPGDRVRTLRTHRAGSVVFTYPDGSACVLWDDGEPQPEGMGHERMPRTLLERVRAALPPCPPTVAPKAPTTAPTTAAPAQAAAPIARRKAYAMELCKTLLRYADPDEADTVVAELEGLVRQVSEARHVPGLVAARYAVFCKFWQGSGSTAPAQMGQGGTA